MQPATIECLCLLFAGRTVVVGIGNRLRGDDGFGPAVAEKLEGRVRSAVVDAGNAPENHLGVIAGHKPDVVLLVDAADFGGGPGDVVLLDADELSTTSFSTHMPALSLMKTYLAAERDVPVVVLAAQPSSTDLGESMSDQMLAAVERTVGLIEAADAAHREDRQVGHGPLGANGRRNANVILKTTLTVTAESRATTQPFCCGFHSAVTPALQPCASIVSTHTSVIGFAFRDA